MGFSVYQCNAQRLGSTSNLEKTICTRIPGQLPIKLFINQTLEDIQNLINKPKSFWAAFSSTPPSSPMTFRPWAHMNETKKQYLRAKSGTLGKVYAELVKNEAEEQQLTADSSVWYFHMRQKRNIHHAFKLINDIEIRQLKSRFNNFLLATIC